MNNIFKIKVPKLTLEYIDNLNTEIRGIRFGVRLALQICINLKLISLEDKEKVNEEVNKAIKHYIDSKFKQHKNGF